jgi:hypothetical protein
MATRYTKPLAIGRPHRPHVIPPCDSEIAEQIGIDLMCRITLSRPWLSIQRFKAHTPHQRPDMFAAHRDALLSQQIPEHARAGKRQFHMQSIDLSHKGLITLGDRLGRVINAAATHPQGFHLFAHR